MLRTLRIGSHARARRFSSKAFVQPTVATMKGWDTAHVVNFAQSEVGLDSDDADILKKNKITGACLLSLTKEDIRRVGMPLGPATMLATTIANVREIRE